MIRGDVPTAISGAALGTMINKVAVVMDKQQADVVIGLLELRSTQLLEGSPGHQLVTDLLDTIRQLV
jgi:hypothetical protein